MPLPVKIILFLLATAGITWVSRSALRSVRSHGFYRFFAWEGILVLFLLNVEGWFSDPFSLRQIVSWTFLILSLVLIVTGVLAFRRQGQIDPARPDAALVGIEKTTELVTSGIYGLIRHPFYSSLLCLCWGILLKDVSWAGAALAGFVTWMLALTARQEEGENLAYFGEPYREYMRRTKRFVPFVV